DSDLRPGPARAAGRRDLRRVVRLPRRADAGATAARRRHGRAGGHRRRAHHPARDQPVDLLPPPAPARRLRVRPAAQGADDHARVGEPGLLHGPAARRRRRHGRARPAALLPRGPAGRRRRPRAGAARLARRAADLRRGDRHRRRHLRDRGARPGRPGRVAARAPVGGRGRRAGRRLGVGEARVGPGGLPRGRGDLALRRGGLPRPRRRQGAGPPAGDRGGRGRAVDPADHDLPGEPGQHRAAPVGRLPHDRPARAHRPPPRRVARHRPDGAPPPRL
ncbi:MAG: Possible phosphinothricin N-acetyltransferase, partial [uncultured Pseudonocardia sp.]